MSQKEFLEEKVKVLETQPNNSNTWFSNEMAHTIYVNQAKGKAAPNVDFQKQKNKAPFRPGKGKYGHVLYNTWCRFCGNNGHTIHECRKRKAMNKKKQSLKNNSATRNFNAATSKTPVATSATLVTANPSDIASTSKVANPAQPRKAKLHWAPKV